MNDSISKKAIVLTYKVQRIVEVDLLDFTLTNDEIEDKIDKIISDNAPDFCDILDSDYEWYGECREPKAKGCEPIPTENCWVEIDGREWATNGWCVVSRETPALESEEYIPAWSPATPELAIKIRELLIVKSRMRQRHLGYFSQRFASIARIPEIEVYGDALSPGYCWVGDRLIAIIMPTQVRSLGLQSEYLTFNQQ